MSAVRGCTFGAAVVCAEEASSSMILGPWGGYSSQNESSGDVGGVIKTKNL